MKIHIHKNCTKMFKAALFIVAKKWKQPKGPSTGEQVNKMSFIPTIEYRSALERSKVLTRAVLWVSLENMVLRERSHI